MVQAIVAKLCVWVVVQAIVAKLCVWVVVQAIISVAKLCVGDGSGDCGQTVCVCV